MHDDDLYEYEELEPQHPAEPAVDENSLSSILGRALKSIEEVGGITRAKLKDLVGGKTYELLLSKPKVAGAIDAFMDASPQTKRSAGKLLAHQIARSTEHPELVDRISRELEDQFSDTYAPPSRLQRLGKEQLTKVRSQQRSGQRVPDLQALARNEDIGAYRRARMNPRGNQRQHRHGVP
jgi:hypothetical protein